MHGLQACLFKYVSAAAFRIYLRVVKMPLKGGGRGGGVGGHALKSHGNYIVDHGKSWKNHGIVFLNFCGNPVTHTNDPWGGIKRSYFFSLLKVVMLHIKGRVTVLYYKWPTFTVKNRL